MHPVPTTASRKPQLHSSYCPFLSTKACTTAQPVPLLPPLRPISPLKSLACCCLPVRLCLSQYMCQGGGSWLHLTSSTGSMHSQPFDDGCATLSLAHTCCTEALVTPAARAKALPSTPASTASRASALHKPGGGQVVPCKQPIHTPVVLLSAMYPCLITFSITHR